MDGILRLMFRDKLAVVRKANTEKSFLERVPNLVGLFWHTFSRYV